MNRYIKCLTSLNPHSTEDAMRIAKNLLALMIVFVTLLPRLAHADEKWEGPKAEFACGSSTVSIGVTAQESAEASALDWDQCVAKYGVEDCFVQPTGTTTKVSCDYKSRHDPTEEALALARASAVLNIFRSLRPEAGNHDGIAPTITMVDRSVKYGYLVIKPRYGAVAISHACNDKIDNDGDGAVDMTDVGCESPDDDSEFNRNSLALYKTGMAISRVLRDASDRRCPWEITAAYNADGSVTVNIEKTDPTCTCDDEKAYAKEADYVAALEAEISNKPPMPTSTTDLDVMFNHYDSVRSIFTDDIGADWNENLFVDYGYIKVVKTQNECTARAETKRLGTYKTGGFVGGNIGIAPVTIPVGSPFNTGTGMDASAHVEGGIVAGDGHVSWIIGAEAGVGWDPSCLQPAGLDLGAFTGPWINRSGRVGFTALANGSWMSSPYNGQWLTTRARFGVDLGVPVQLGASPLSSKTYVVPSLGIGADLVYGESSPGAYVLTERRVGPKIGVAFVKTF